MWGIRRGITADVLIVTDTQFDTIERVLVSMRISVEMLADYPVQAYRFDRGGTVLKKSDNIERDTEIEWKRPAN